MFGGSTLPAPPVHAKLCRFRCRCRLDLQGWSLGTPLPDLQPGALPALEQLQLSFGKQHCRLPDSWGSPGVLPRLRELKLYLGSMPALPESWAAGFPQLTTLLISAAQNDGPPPCESAASVRARGLQLFELPAAWGSGFPAVRMLKIGVGASGTIPPSWLAGFPSLTHL